MAANTKSLLTVLVFAYCNLANAQTGRERHGIWLDGALGPGWVHVSSDTLQGRNQTGIDGILAIGWTLGSRVRAGIGWAQWTSQWGAGKQNWVTSYDILVYYYPFPHRTFFLEAAVGSGDYLVVHVPAGGQRADSISLSGSAWGPTVAIGWDASLGRGRSVGSIFSFRPRLSYSYGPPRTLQSGDGTVLATGWRHHVLSLDIGVVMHPPDSR